MRNPEYYAIAAGLTQALVECKNASEKHGCEKAIEHVMHALQVENPTTFSPNHFKKTIINMYKHMKA